MAMTVHSLLKPVWKNNTVLRAKIPDLSLFPSLFDSSSVFTFAYSISTLPFDETHGACCPVPLRKQSGVEQHAAPAIWILF